MHYFCIYCLTISVVKSTEMHVKKAYNVNLLSLVINLY